MGRAGAPVPCAWPHSVASWSAVIVAKKCPRCRKAYDEGVPVCPDDGATPVAAPPLDAATAAALSKDYRILDWLGAGGMGAVYLAEQIRVGSRKVALKVLHRKFSEDEEFITRFENEAASTGRINHPNVITIYESKQAADGTLYIAMELVEGESLTEHLRKQGRLPLAEIADIVAQCCKALGAAHRLGIIHRDIKPDNIMLTRDHDGGLHVKILDFGIAKLKDSGGHTVTGSVLGTPAYMSYEQASGLSSEKLDGRSDIYSLGIVTYVMLVGHPPFRAETPVGYITKHLSEAPPAIRLQRPDIPAAVEAAVMKALEKDRDQRYQTAADFAAALREALAAAAAPGPVEVTPATTPAPPWRARTPTTEVGRSAESTAPGRTPTAPGQTPTVPTPTFRPVPTPTVPPPSFRPVPTPTAPPASRAAGLTPASPPPPAPPPTPAAPSPAVSPAGAAPLRPAAPVVSSPAPPAGPRPTSPPGPSSAALRPPKTGTVPVTAPAMTPPATGRRSAGGTAAPAVAAESWDGLAVSVWGLRTLLSWGLSVYAVVLLVLFGRPFIAAFVPPGAFVPLDIVGQRLIQPVGQWFPVLRYEGLDFVPLLLGVLLLVLRPRITTPLWRLESRWRARALSQEPLG